jgi:hypothetical protein
MVEDIQERMVSQALPRAVDNITYAIDSYQTAKDDPQLREHGYKASIATMQAANVLPSNSPSVYIQQIFATGDVHLTQELTQLTSFLNHTMMPVIDITSDDSLDHATTVQPQSPDDNADDPPDSQIP